MAEDIRKLYDLQAGGRVFRDVSAAVIIKNIRNGKLKPEDELSSAGAERWIQLRDVPELRKFFGGVPEQERAPDPNLFDLRRGSEEESGLSRGRLVEMIRMGEVNEADQVRQHGGAVWTMAGDMQSLQRFFEIRRNLLRQRGHRGLPRDTGEPFYRDFRTPLEFFARPAFYFNLIAIVAALTFASFVQIPIIAGPINVLTTLYVFAYYFRTLNDASSGKRAFPDMVDFADFLGELVRPAVQFLLSRAYAVAPLLAYLMFWVMRGHDFFVQQPFLAAVFTLPWLVLIMPFPKSVDLESITDSLLQMQGAEALGAKGAEEQLQAAMNAFFHYLTFDPVVWLGLFIFVLYFSIALMRQAAYGEFLPTIDIRAVVLSVSRAFGPFMALVGIMVLLDLVVIGATLLSIVIFGLSYNMSAALYPIDATNPLIVRLSLTGIQMVINTIDMLGGFLKMYFLGRFVWQYSEQMGWD